MDGMKTIERISQRGSPRNNNRNNRVVHKGESTYLVSISIKFFFWMIARMRRI